MIKYHLTVSLGQHIPYLPTAYMYDSVQLYARAISELYATRESNTTTVEDIARNGTKIKNYLKNITYESKCDIPL